jgi:AraC-like DNA-binding protein
MKLQAAPHPNQDPGKEVPIPDEFALQYLVPVPLSTHRCLEYDFGHIIDQQIPVGPHTIHLSHVISDRVMTVYAFQSRPLLGILYGIRGAYYCRLRSDNKEVLISTGDYGPYYTPPGVNEVRVTAGVSGALHILLEPDYLVKGMASINPQLYTLLEALHGNIPDPMAIGVFRVNEAIQKGLTGIIAYDVAIKNPGIYLQGILYTLVTELMAQLNELQPAITVNTSAREKVKEVYAFITQQPNIQTCTLENLASEYRISKANLRKLFKEIYQQSLHQVVRQQCLQKAAKMLLNDASIRIKDIADSLGYANDSNFSNAFKTTYGKSPAEYRKSL